MDSAEVSPPFELSFGHKFPSVTYLGCDYLPLDLAEEYDIAWLLRFKMMIYPEMVNEGKGGSCFRTILWKKSLVIFSSTNDKAMVQIQDSKNLTYCDNS